MKYLDIYLANRTVANRNKVILANIGLVKYILNKYRGFARYQYEDYYQQAMIGFIIALERFDPAKGNPAGYCYTWMKNLILRYMELQARQTNHIAIGTLRKTKQFSVNRVNIDDVDIPDTQDSFDLVSTKEQYSQLREAVSNLNDNQKVLIDQLFVDELTLAEVGVGASRQAVHSRLQRVIKQLERIV